MKFWNIKASPTDVVLLRITCVAWFIAKVMSFKLWTADRLFPTIPTFDFLQFDNSVHLGLYVISILGIAVVFFFPSKKIIASLIIVEIVSCLLDQMRWQPWQFQYLLTLMFFLFAKDRKQFLSLFVLLMGCTYFYSGIHKFDGSFLYTFWDKLVLTNYLHLDTQTIKMPVVHYLGLVPCLIEIVIGVGIIFFRNKKYFCIAALLMHLFIILIYGPTGTNHNNIIVPWNVAMMLFLLVFIFRKEVPQLQMQFFRSKLNTVAFILVGILPILSYFSQWDQYLSFNLYSGNTKILALCVDDVQQYPELQHYAAPTKTDNYCNSSHLIKLNNWALEELKVPVIPEERAFKKIKEQFNARYPDLKSSFVFNQYPYKKENIQEVE